MVKNSKSSFVATKWHKYKLEDIYNISAGGDFNSNTSSTTKDKMHQYPIYANALTNKGLYGYSTHAKHDADSITITARGDIGVAYYRKTKFTAIGRLLVLKNKIPASNEFVCEYINHSIRFLKETTGVPQLTIPQVGKYYVLLPPLEEQKKIVEVLSTWDEAIEKLEKLISAKEKQFKWLLKTLITDQQNNSSWQKSKLKQITHIRKGQQLNRTTLSKFGKYPVQNGGIEPSGYTDKWNTKENVITISEGGNSCGFVKFNKQKFWSGGHCYSLTNVSIKVEDKFLFYYLKNNEKRIMRLRVGSGLPNIQKSDIECFSVIYPDLKVQEQIANTVGSKDKEIELLKQLSKKYQEQKKGLMQKLLTGK